MAIANFNFQEFSKSLAQQAIDVVPSEFPKDKKNYIVDKVYRFSALAGNALNEDPNISINADQACIITQFIGEWTFHKSIDIIRAGLPPETWDPILQQIAFAVFEAAKHTQLNHFDQDQSAELIEKEVVKAYQKSLNDLVKEGKISAESIQNILSFSNIDQMSADSHNAKQITPEEEDKALRLASLAVLLNSLPKEKAISILNGLDEHNANEVKNYMRIPNLNQKIDAEITKEILDSLKKKVFLNASVKLSKSLNLSNVLKFHTANEVKDAVKREREGITALISSSIDPNHTPERENNLSPQVIDVIQRHISMKLK